MAQAPALPTGFELPLEPRLPRIGSIDQVAVEERAATLAKRSIKRESKVFALELAVRMTDLTTLEGSDTPAKVDDEIVRIKEACGGKHLKVILETGELGTYDNVRRASLLAIAAGGDFIKTSTGKLPSAATLPVALVMLEAIRDVYEETGRRVGFKPAGGIRNAKQAIQHLVLTHETLGTDWLTPDLYRFGASSLLNDILMQLRKEKTGRYQSPDYFTID